MKRTMATLTILLLAACGGNIDGKKSSDSENNSVNNQNSANAENQTTGPVNGKPGPNNEPTPNNEPQPINNGPDPTNNEPQPINNEPEPNNEPQPTNNEPEPTNTMTTGDACDNGADLEAVTDTETPYVARDCQLECVNDAAPRECTAECVSFSVGTSEGCSLCVADLTQCGFDSCLEPCIEDPYAADCVACLDMFCDDDFVQCAGIPAR